MCFPIRGAAPLGFSYSRSRSSWVFLFRRFRRVPGKKSRIFSPGTRQKVPIFFAGYPARNPSRSLLFSYSRRRSSCVFLFEEPLLFGFPIPAGTRQKIPIFLPGTRQKNADFVAGRRSSCVFLFEEPLLLCFPIRGAAHLVFLYSRSRSS